VLHSQTRLIFLSYLEPNWRCWGQNTNLVFVKINALYDKLKVSTAVTILTSALKMEIERFSEALTSTNKSTRRLNSIKSSKYFVLFIAVKMTLRGSSINVVHSYDHSSLPSDADN
jgi:hypothetical protein